MLRDSIRHPSKTLWSLNWLRDSTFNFKRLDILRDSIRHPSKKLWSLNLLRDSTSNFERLDILRDSIRHPSKTLLLFELAQSCNIQFRASRYVTGLNQTSAKKFIVVWIGSEVQHSISSVSICYGTQADIREKSYCRLNLLRGSTFNFERLDILRDSIRHPSKNLLLFELAQSFNIQFRASRYVTGLNQTSE